MTIGETASSIQFRHRSGGAMKIINITASLSTWSGQNENQPGGIAGSSSQVEQLANDTLVVLEHLRPYTSLDEEETYLMPIKRKAGQVLIMVRARGQLSNKTAMALIALKQQIDFAKDFLNVSLEQEGLFDDAVEILAIREKIDDLLN